MSFVSSHWCRMKVIVIYLLWISGYVVVITNEWIVYGLCCYISILWYCWKSNPIYTMLLELNIHRDGVLKTLILVVSLYRMYYHQAAALLNIQINKSIFCASVGNYFYRIHFELCGFDTLMWNLDNLFKSSCHRNLSRRK